MTAPRNRNVKLRRRSARPAMESLESRLALTGPASLSAAIQVAVTGDTLFVEGTAKADQIQILPTKFNGFVRVVSHGKSLGAFGPVARIDISTGAGADSVVVDPRITLPTRIDGGAGNDRLRGGSGPNTLIGDDGNDTLIGTQGRDTFDGGIGRNQTIFLENLGVVQVSAAASGAGVKRVAKAYALMSLKFAGPALIGAADLQNPSTVSLLKNDYDNGQAVTIANPTQSDANALASLLGDPRPVDLSGSSRADLVSFRKTTIGGKANFSVSVVLPVADVATSHAERLAGTQALRKSDRIYFNKLFTSAPASTSSAPVGSPEDSNNLIDLAHAYSTSTLYSDNQGDQTLFTDTVYAVRSFDQQQDLFYVTQEAQSSGLEDIGQVGVGAGIQDLNSPKLNSIPIIQPSPASTGGPITQYTNSVSQNFSGSIGWNQSTGFNASFNTNLSLSSSTTYQVPSITVQYFPIFDIGKTNWLFVSNSENLSQYTANTSWIWRVPFSDYFANQTQLTYVSYADIGPMTGPTTYQFEKKNIVPLPFGDTRQLDNPNVASVSVPTVQPGGEFIITGTGFYPSLVEGVTIGGQLVGPAGFAVLDNEHIQVVAPVTPGNAQPVIVKSIQGLSNENVTINIAAASQLNVQVQPVSALVGQALTSVTVATMTDSDINANPAQFSATINWGDGTTSPGTVSASSTPGSFLVAGSHTYATAGSYTVSVQATDPHGTKATGSNTATVTAPNIGPQNLVVQAITATAGQAFSNQSVGTFTDSDPNAKPSDFAATIGWGDGSTSNGIIASLGSGNYIILASHTYTSGGSYPVSLDVTGPGNTKATASGTATVSSGNIGPQNLVAQPFSATAGQAFANQTIGTFSDSDPNVSLSDFAATIGWGDGTTSNGLIASIGSGNYLILGGHTYANGGSLNVSLDVTGPGNTKATSSTTATVSGSTASGPQNLTTKPVSAVVNLAFVDAVLATFTDSAPNISASDFTASIDWGDGISTPSTTVTLAGSGTFDVLGTHTYTAAGTYTFNIQVTDNQNRKVTASGTATVTS